MRHLVHAGVSFGHAVVVLESRIAGRGNCQLVFRQGFRELILLRIHRAQREMGIVNIAENNLRPLVENWYAK